MESIEKSKLSRREFSIAVVAWTIPVAISIWAVMNSNKGAPDYYAAPSQLKYCYTESNLLKDDKPFKGALTIKVRNNGSTPARNIKLVIIPISQNTEITADEKYESQDGPFGTKIIRIGRIAPGETAMVDIVDFVDVYPASFGVGLGNTEFKYQYFPAVVDVQTEFGPVSCDYEYCGRLCLRLPDDGGQPDNHIPSKVVEALSAQIKN